jgi:hypothetical protein
MDLRKRVIEACEEEQTTAQVAERFKVRPSFVEKLQSPAGVSLSDILAGRPPGQRQFVVAPGGH